MPTKPLHAGAVSPAFWRKKEVVSFCLSVLVFLIHISTFYNYTNIGVVSLPTMVFWRYVSECITDFAVPMFFILSGAVFFRDYKKGSYVPKLKSRLRTLLIPFLVWNTIWMLFDLICTNTSISELILARQKFAPTAANILNGIFHYGRNLPFWFLFALLCFVLISPLIDLIMRNKYVALGVIGTLWVLRLFDIGLPYPLFFKQSSLIFYLIGAYVGKHGFSLLLRPSSRKRQLLSVFALLLISFAFYNLPAVSSAVLRNAFADILDLLAAAAFWCAADLFADKLGRFSFVGASFAVFAMHTNVSAVVTKLCFYALPKKEAAGYANFFLTIVITLMIIVIFYRIICRFFPKMAKVLFGRSYAK